MSSAITAEADLHPDFVREIEEYASEGPTPRAREARRQVRRNELVSTLRRFRALDAIIEESSSR